MNSALIWFCGCYTVRAPMGDVVMVLVLVMVMVMVMVTGGGTVCRSRPLKSDSVDPVT